MSCEARCRRRSAILRRTAAAGQLLTYRARRRGCREARELVPACFTCDTGRRAFQGEGLGPGRPPCGTFAGERDYVTGDVRGACRDPCLPLGGPPARVAELRLPPPISRPAILGLPSGRRPPVTASLRHWGCLIVFYFRFSFLPTFEADHFTAFVCLVKSRVKVNL